MSNGNAKNAATKNRGSSASKRKLTDAERHARFLETARKVEASDDPKDFDKAFKVITSKHSK